MNTNDRIWRNDPLSTPPATFPLGCVKKVRWIFGWGADYAAKLLKFTCEEACGRAGNKTVSSELLNPLCSLFK